MTIKVLVVSDLYVCTGVKTDHTNQNLILEVRDLATSQSFVVVEKSKLIVVSLAVSTSEFVTVA